MSVYSFSATVTSEDGFSAVASQPFTVTTGGGTTATTGIFGVTINGPTGTNLNTAIQNWNTTVAPSGAMKIYFQNKSNPPPTSVASNNQIQAAATLGIPVILCFEPTWWGATNDPTWPGGANKPAQGAYAAGQTGTILGDQYDMVQCINGLQKGGVTVLAAVMWQECDNLGKYQRESAAGAPATPTLDQPSYLYYQNYAALKAKTTGVQVGISYSGYQYPYSITSSTNLAPYKTPARPNDTVYVDFITCDVYGNGYHTFNYTPYSVGPGITPSGTQRWGLADLADYAGVGFGWIESGNTANASQLPTQAYMTAYLIDDPTYTAGGVSYPGDPVNSVQALFKYRLGANLPTLPYCWYESLDAGGTTSSGPNAILLSTDFRVPLLKRVYQTLNGG